MKPAVYLASALCLVGISGIAVAAVQPKFTTAEQSAAEFERSVRPFLVRHCTACHGADLAEKDLNLERLQPDMKASTSAARWAVVLQKLQSGEMPPKDEPRPRQDAVTAVVNWVEAELKRAGKHVAMREDYRNGNVVDHAALFDPQQSAPFDSPTRVRPVTSEIYAAFVQDVAKNTNLGQPFSPEGGTTFKDMGAPRLDELTTSQLIDNALVIVERRLAMHTLEDGVAKPQQGAPKEVVRLFDEQDPPTEKDFEVALRYTFDLVLRRRPTPDEIARFTGLMQRNIEDAGRETGVKYTLAAVFLLPEVVFRSERGAGPANGHGRVRLAPPEIAFALAYALTDRRPEPWLLAEAEKGTLETDAGVAAAVRRMLDDPKLQKPRIMRFFREYFGYEQATEVFKDPEDNREHFPRELVADTERLIAWILERDQEVLRELLTTNQAFVNYRWDANKRQGFKARNEAVHLAYGLPPDWKWTAVQPVELPADQRAGILTQPSWLVAFSKSDDNDVIHRGKWIRERLLGNVVPDIPITVDAQLPVAPERTLRERMAVTHEAYCWQCHRLMNHLGFPFEMYDHFGRFRTVERVLDPEATAENVDGKGKPLGPVLRGVPVDAGGAVEHVGHRRVEGRVTGAVELMHKLADSERVEQVFVRHAFRYWLGRNETPGDAPTLRAAHRAYRESGGSMKALITALLSSESFLYRVPSQNAARDPAGPSG